MGVPPNSRRGDCGFYGRDLSSRARPASVDPEFAAAAGFPKPTLQGRCTYGMTCKALVDTLPDADVSQVQTYGARFAGVVYPGETIKVNVWNEDGGYIGVVTAPGRDDAVIISESSSSPIRLRSGYLVPERIAPGRLDLEIPVNSTR